MTGHSAGAVSILPVAGLPEVVAGDDLAALLVAAMGEDELRVGDVLVVSSKVVSKALGLNAAGDSKESLVLDESVRVVAERSVGDEGRVTRVVESLAGPVMAAAGIDASNTGPSGALLLLPHDPDACAASLRSNIQAVLGMPSSAPFAVVLSDTAGRPWRAGLTDFALGSAGLVGLLDHRGQLDADGRLMSVTARAVADEIAAAADLVKGKADGVAAAVVRGLPEGWLSVEGSDDFGSGARQLVRTGASDWFARGPVEALRAALGVAPGSADSEQVGIRSVGPETFADRVGRVVALTLFADEDASADVALPGGAASGGAASGGALPADRGGAPGAAGITGAGDDLAVVTLGAADDFALGRLTLRLEVAAASEDLEAHLVSAPTAEHTVTVHVSSGPPPAS